MEVKFINNKANIEGLTFRQLALIEALVNEASMAGGYQIDIDDYNEIMKGFETLDIKNIFNLKEEKREIEESVRKIMREAKVEPFREQFKLMQQCEDNEVRTLRLRDLMTEMEGRFNIPLLKDEKYNQANPEVMILYLEVSNARIF